MKNNQVFILHCSVSADVRQSVQIAFEDYKLPQEVVETLREADSISIRPSLSRALKKSLDELRLMQRYLYDRCTISHGDVHFLHQDYFEEAKQRIEEIKRHAKDCNASLFESWAEELQKWKTTVNNFFSPLFDDEEQLNMVIDAYLRIFPTQKEFTNPIVVNVVGPYPAVIERCENPKDLQQIIANEAAINTQQVLEAAKHSAVDYSLNKVAELLDDLDARPANKIDKKVISDNPSHRGKWQVMQQEITLAAKHNPVLTRMADLCNKLLTVGKNMRDPLSGAVRMAAFKEYSEVRQDIADEAKDLLSRASVSEGYLNLQKSVAMTNNYQSLLVDVSNCQTPDQLEAVRQQIDTQMAVYKHRTKHLAKLVAKAEEKINLDKKIEEVKEVLSNEMKQKLSDQKTRNDDTIVVDF